MTHCPAKWISTRSAYSRKRDLRFTVSMGVSSLSSGMDGEALVNAADAAMYQAKQAGKNQVCGPEGCLLT